MKDRTCTVGRSNNRDFGFVAVGYNQEIGNRLVFDGGVVPFVRKGDGGHGNPSSNIVVCEGLEHDYCESILTLDEGQPEDVVSLNLILECC